MRQSKFLVFNSSEYALFYLSLLIIESLVKDVILHCYSFMLNCRRLIFLLELFINNNLN